MEENKTNKPKFSFSNKVKKDLKENKESENFNIDELKQYYKNFMADYNNIKSEFLKLKGLVEMNTDKEILKENLQVIENKYKELKDNYINNASFLVGHDKQVYMNLLDEINSLLEEQKEGLNPKKKFAFSNKSKINKEKEINESLPVSLNSGLDSTNNNYDKFNTNDGSNMTDYLIKDISKTKLNVSKGDIGDKNNLILENIEECEILILHSFKALYVKNIKNSKIIIGSVGGGSHITNVKESSIYLSTHQLRIHKTYSTHFYIIATSNPIIENSKDLKFTPLSISYSNFEENLKLAGIEPTKNKWNGVLDFNWHKKEKSPNFEYEDCSLLLEL